MSASCTEMLENARDVLDMLCTRSTGPPPKEAVEMVEEIDEWLDNSELNV